MFQYTFISTVTDLLDSDEACRSFRLGRYPFRLLILLLGIVWFIAGIISFDLSNFSGRSAIWFLLGGSVIFYFFINPIIIRLRIQKTKNEKLFIIFDNEQIVISFSDNNKTIRNWGELIKFIDAKKGIVFYFDDGVINWLPNRVFNNKEERDSFIAFLKNKKDEIDR